MSIPVGAFLVLCLLGLMTAATSRAESSDAPASAMPSDMQFSVLHDLTGIPYETFTMSAIAPSHFALTVEQQKLIASWLSDTQKYLDQPNEGLLIEVLIAKDKPGWEPEKLIPLGTDSGLVETAASALYSQPGDAIPPSDIDLERSGFRWFVRRNGTLFFLDLIRDQAEALRREGRALAGTADFNGRYFALNDFLKEPSVFIGAVPSCLDLAVRYVNPRLDDYIDRADAIRNIYCRGQELAAREATLRQVVEAERTNGSAARNWRDAVALVNSLLERHLEALARIDELATLCTKRRMEDAPAPACLEILNYVLGEIATMKSETASETAALRTDWTGGDRRRADKLTLILTDHAAQLDSLAKSLQ